MARSLAATLQQFVSSSSRRRGESYFHGGRVSVTTSTSTALTAIVRGTRAYNVELSLDADRLVASCTCPYFDDSGDPCKHIWATVLAADGAGTFRVSANLWLDTEPELDSLDEDEFADVDFEEPLLPGERLRTAARMKQYWAERRNRTSPASPAAGGAQRSPAPRPAPPPAWQTFLQRIAPGAEVAPARAMLTGELIYVLDFARSASARGLFIELMTRERKKSGDWAKPKPLTLNRYAIGQLPDARDRHLLEIVCGAEHAYAAYGWGTYSGAAVPSSFILNPTLQRELARRLCETNRLLLRVASNVADARSEPLLVPLEWDASLAEFQVRVSGDPEKGYTIDGVVRADHVARPLGEAMFVTSALIVWKPALPDQHPRLAAFDAGGADRWLAHLLEAGPISVPASETQALVETLATSDLVHIDCPDTLRVEVRAEAPQPVVRVARGDSVHRYHGSAARLDVTLSFAYGSQQVDAWSMTRVIFDRERHTAWRRDGDFERAAIARLLALGVRRLADWNTGGTRLDLAESALPTLVRVLLAEGWHVEADGRLYRRPGGATLDVRSGIDWFELHGAVDFDGVQASLPALLAAAKRGDAFVPLGDGTFGLLPEDWLAHARRIASMGSAQSDHVRFARAQTALLDAWLATQSQVSADDAFARARAALARFDGVAAAAASPTFTGELRRYQREALGWFEFLRQFGFGGCLADEMGLGKTVMVIAALESRRVERERAGQPPRPSLIVVPRSLVFNWRQEATRFAPGLRVLDFTGGSRRDSLAAIADHDLVLTTYGTLRRDIAELKEIAFDYAVLDEAQAIKNARTSSAKAAKLLRADHRLALSGTPVENHLGELWSLFDFLNAGVLGTSTLFAGTGGTARTGDEETLALLARGLRPFILRRTKEQVARELPARTEQTLYCDLEAPQRALYNELRDHYRASLLGKVRRDGLGRSKLQILEALLRLRQAACHPALIDPARAADPAAKLDVLLPRLQELVDDGRKVLVFSQFTSLLALLRTRLDDVSLAYEYLDGKTRDRQARVERFQSNGCPLFLVSLKAGGLGLNLTAAEYVFLLDPWWNPAVEAQAIDRAHRIGQTRPVFAFRLIARDTVEEKVLELQATKRKLADAIVRADENLISDLRREDLELLLS